MKENKIIALCLLLLMICLSVEVQAQKNSKRPRTTQIQKTQKELAKTDTVLATSPKVEPKSKSFSDPVVVRYLRGGFSKEKKLHLVTNPDYAALSESNKQEVLKKVAQEFSGYDMILYTGNQERELWVADGHTVKCIEQWNNDSLHMENYMPLELKRSGETKVFYYIGGMLNGGDDYTSYSLNLRAGSYLYKNLLDASVTLNLGNSKSNGVKQAMFDVGVDSRAYLPFRIKSVNLAPYVGAGISWTLEPENYFELRLLAGGCWFIGPGSLDIGFQYGTKSDCSVTLGYTFRIPSKKK